MKKDTLVEISDRATVADTLTELLRKGAQELIRQAVEAALQELLEQHSCPSSLFVCEACSAKKRRSS